MQLPVSAVRQNEITQQMWDHLQTINGVDMIQVHPTFLYESLWNLGVLLIILLLRKRRKFKGQIFCMYLIGYGSGRAWIEGLRTDQLLLPGQGFPYRSFYRWRWWQSALFYDLPVEQRKEKRKSRKAA